MAEKVEELIGYCGYNCHLCTTRSEDIAVRQAYQICIKFYLKQESSPNG